MLSLSIPASFTVKRRATIAGVGKFTRVMIEISGDGTFEVVDSVVNTTMGIAIATSGASSNVTSNGGLVFAYGSIVIGDGNVILGNSDGRWHGRCLESLRQRQL